MNTVTKLVGGALGAVLVSTTLALAGNGVAIKFDKQHVQIAKVASCTVAGTPSEFPDDLRFTNKGVGVLKAGTRISWTLTGYNKKGTYMLVADLSPGATAFASGILGSGVEAGRDCKAKVL
jgi:invasion protein IalB